MTYKHYIMTGQSVVVIFDTGQMPIPVENPMYRKVVEALKEHRFEDVPSLVDMATKIREASNGQFYIVDGAVMINDEKLPDALSKRLIAFADAELPCDALVNFWGNLKLNPSAASVEQLYGFLEHNGIPITEDGCFIAYKSVSRNGNALVDTYTRKISNAIGTVVTMDRSKVDDNPNQTCSHGLHVAAYRYSKFSYPGDVMIEVKVDPKDVVAVPTDYNNEKMRVCRYEVMRECEGEIDRPLYEASDVDFDDLYDPDDITSASGDTVEVTVTPDGSRERVCIPKSIVKEMDLIEGDTVDAVAFNGFLRIQSNAADTTEKGVVEIRTYMVDKSRNVRLSASLFDVAGMSNRTSYKAVYCDDTGCVIVK